MIEDRYSPKPEYIPVSKDVLKTLDEVLAQNRKILNQNYAIIQSLMNPVLVCNDELSTNESST